jgi:hypothetical protein
MKKKKEKKTGNKGSKLQEAVSNPQADKQREQVRVGRA